MQKFANWTRFLKNIKSIEFKRNNVIVLLSLLVLFNVEIVSCNEAEREGEDNDPTAHISGQCMQNCPEQVSWRFCLNF
jgi:hypothetical protein